METKESINLQVFLDYYTVGFIIESTQVKILANVSSFHAES